MCIFLLSIVKFLLFPVVSLKMVSFQNLDRQHLLHHLSTFLLSFFYVILPYFLLPPCTVCPHLHQISLPLSSICTFFLSCRDETLCFHHGCFNSRHPSCFLLILNAEFVKFTKKNCTRRNSNMTFRMFTFTNVYFLTAMFATIKVSLCCIVFVSNCHSCCCIAMIS